MCCSLNTIDLPSFFRQSKRCNNNFFFRWFKDKCVRNLTNNLNWLITSSMILCWTELNKFKREKKNCNKKIDRGMKTVSMQFSFFQFPFYNKVGPKSTFKKTQCQCVIGLTDDDDKHNSHQRSRRSSGDSTNQTPAPPQQRSKRKITRATFASSFFPAPNPIDFSSVFSGFVNLDDNPLVFSVVLSIFGVYLLLLFWARREDRKDLTKVKWSGFIRYRNSTFFGPEPQGGYLWPMLPGVTRIPPVQLSKNILTLWVLKTVTIPAQGW